MGLDVEDGGVVGEIDIEADGAGSGDRTGSEDALTSTQLRSWQAYPCGQHMLPHFGRSPVSFVVLMELPGSTATFCSCTSHVIGRMVLQSDPLGQQITVLALSITKQSEFSEQQKFLGTLGFPHCMKPDFAHICSRGKRPGTELSFKLLAVPQLYNKER